MRTSKLLLITVIVVACLGGAGQASAATCNSQASGSWGTTSTWSCNKVPDSGDSVTIVSGHDVTFTAAGSAGSLSMSGGTITFSGGFTLSAGSMTATIGTLRGNGAVTVAGSFSKTGPGTLTVTNNGALGSPDLTLNGAAVHDGGFIDPCRNGDQDPDQVNLHINSTFTIAAGAHAIPFNCSGGRLHVNAPNGHLIKAPGGAATTTIHPQINNDGTVTVQGGELILNGGTGANVSDGDYIADSGATLDFANNFQLADTSRVGGAGTVDVNALSLRLPSGATLDPAVLNASFGELVLDGTSAVNIPTVNQTGATIDTDRPLTFTNYSTTGGGISGNGSVTVPVGGSFSKTGPGTLSITNSGASGAAELILNVNAFFDGGRIDACRSGDQDPDQPKLHINRDFTIGPAVEFPAFNCSGSGDNIRVNGPSGHLKKSGAGTTTSHTGILVNGGTLSLTNGQALTLNNFYAQSGGLTDIAGGATLAAANGLAFTGGVLRGSGQVTGNVTNTSGTVSPGASPGTLSINGNYSQGSGGTLLAEITGTTPGTQFDRLAVTGTVALNGTLAIDSSSFTPALTDTFQILTGSAVSGTFSQLTGATRGNRIYGAQYNPADVTLTVSAGADPPPPPPPEPPKQDPPVVNQGPPPLISAQGCLNTTATLSGKVLGPAQLGRGRVAQRAIFKGANIKTARELDRYCAEGGGTFRIGYPTARLNKTLGSKLRKAVKEKVVLILTSSPRFTLSGIKRGDKVAAALKALKGEKKFKVGSNTWYVTSRGGSRLLVKTSGGLVREIGIGDTRLTRNAVEIKRFLKTWQLG